MPPNGGNLPTTPLAMNQQWALPPRITRASSNTTSGVNAATLTLFCAVQQRAVRRFGFGSEQGLWAPSGLLCLRRLRRVSPASEMQSSQLLPPPPSHRRGGTMCEDPHQFPLQLRCNQRQRFVRRHELLGQVTPPPPPPGDCAKGRTNAIKPLRKCSPPYGSGPRHRTAHEA